MVEERSIGEGPLVFHHLTHRRWIGALGMLLPALVWIADGFAPLRPSVSDYYYSEVSRNVFVGVLFALAVFFISYKGYRNGRGFEKWGDEVLTNLAAFFAVIVAFVPTRGDLATVHLLAAASLFLSMAVMSGVQFPRGKTRPAFKGIYVGAAVIMVCVLGFLGLTIDPEAEPDSTVVFWAEVVLLEVFGISWLVKGLDLRGHDRHA